MTRNGKIARLPLAIRQQLNQRLRQGQKGRQLIAWLNELPEVQSIMASEFDRQPITEYNFSRWKSGGYKCWQEEQDMREAAAAMLEETTALQDLPQAGLSKRIAAILTANLAMELRRVDTIREGTRKSRRQRDLLERFLALRRWEVEGERLRIEQAKLAFQCKRSRMDGEKE